jgi:hypothetical protein
MLFIFRGSTDYAIKSFTMLFIFRGSTDYGIFDGLICTPSKKINNILNDLMA